MSFKQLQLNAASGDPEAQFQLGRAYDCGDGTKRNPKKAFTWYSKAANQHHTEALEHLAEFYQNGIGCEEDNRKAIQCLKEAAEKGSSSAQFSLADALLDIGECSEAIDILKSKADSGSCEAQFKLGEIFSEGVKIPKSDCDAFKWYEQAAIRGFGEAYVKVGQCLATGVGVTRNFPEAISWLLKVATPHSTVSAGDMHFAQLMLSDVYASGDFPGRNVVEAYKWLNLAIAYWPTWAADDQRLTLGERREKIAFQMSQEDIQRAQAESAKLFIFPEKLKKPG